ncbi:hypothetical protein [uncultured Fibrella sp.]|uniref:hypothetical protein n=1 Tax=uncultured Fibrella sp. TaxID=1284596 RepID=UPI0035CB8F59
MVQTNTFGGIGGGEANLGYIAEFWLIDVRDVIDLAKPVLTQAGLQFPIGAVALASDAAVTHFRFGAKACTAGSDVVRSEAGIAYSVTITGSMPKPDMHLLGWLLLNARRRWLVIWRDRNGMLWLGGQPDQGLRLDWKQVTADRNALELSLTGLTTKPPIQLTATTLETMFPVGEFDYSFDYSFNS